MKTVMQDGLDHVKVVFFCPNGHRHITVHVTHKQYEELQSPNRRKIQDILPDHSAYERELFLTGICPACWEKLFKSDD